MRANVCDWCGKVETGGRVQQLSFSLHVSGVPMLDRRLEGDACDDCVKAARTAALDALEAVTSRYEEARRSYVLAADPYAQPVREDKNITHESHREHIGSQRRGDQLEELNAEVTGELAHCRECHSFAGCILHKGWNSAGDPPSCPRCKEESRVWCGRRYSWERASPNGGRTIDACRLQKGHQGRHGWKGLDGSVICPMPQAPEPEEADVAGAPPNKVHAGDYPSKGPELGGPGAPDRQDAAGTYKPGEPLAELPCGHTDQTCTPEGCTVGDLDDDLMF